MKRTVALLLGLLAASTPAAGGALDKSYSYFSIGGRTLDDIERELNRRGPHVRSTGRRHPGATQMRFATRLTFASTDRWCEIEKATVTVHAKIILPRWSQRRRAESDVALIWDTLSADIKRHEEQHALIAKNHAYELERALEALDRRRDCDLVKAAAAKVNERILAKHDREQERFDRVESRGFERRILRLLEYRMERMERQSN